MATTYHRINEILRYGNRRDNWSSVAMLATDMRQRRLLAFRVRGDGSAIDHYMSQESVQALIRLSINFGLIDESKDGSIRLAGRSIAALESNDAFSRLIRSSVMSYLENHLLPIDTIHEIISKIKLPDVPDAKTIYERAELRNPKPDINMDSLRRALFLLYHAEGLGREFKVYYGTQE